MKKILCILVGAIVFLNIGCQTYADLPDFAVTSTTAQAQQNITKPNDSAQFDMKCKAALLMDAGTGQILYKYNENEKLRPASVTKIMTMILIMDAIERGNLKYEDKITCSENASNMGGSQIWFKQGEQLTVKETLKAIAVVSANDVCVAMAEHIAGDQSNFVNMMNEKAKELGMNDTHFENCHGIDSDNHMTSANDIAIMSKELITKYPEILKYTGIWMDSLRDGKSELVNTNKLIRFYQGANGIKTGSTSLALFNVSVSATREKMTLICVIMGAESSKVRNAEATKLLDYGFSKYGIIEPNKKGDILGQIIVGKGMENYVNAIVKNNANYLILKNKNIKVDKIIQLPNSIEAPIIEGQKLGEVIYNAGGIELGKLELIAEREVKRISYFGILSRLLERWVRVRE